MPYSQIRINKTKEVQEILRALKKHYKALSESEIVKMALSKIYAIEMNVDVDNDDQWETVVDFTEGGKTDGMPAEEAIALIERINKEDE